MQVLLLTEHSVHGADKLQSVPDYELEYYWSECAVYPYSQNMLDDLRF